LLVLIAVLSGFAGTSVTAAHAAQQTGWDEGFTLSTDRAINCGIQGGGFRITDITATKSFDANGNLSSSSFEIFVNSGIIPANTTSTSIGPVDVDVPVDPDYLSVSRDLGWAGLDASVSLHDAATNSNVPVDIHLSLFAVSGTTEQAGVFARAGLAASDLPGTPFGLFTNDFGTTAPVGKVVIVKGISFLTACPLHVSIFSTREPDPRF
jgi:hypothetical protein